MIPSLDIAHLSQWIGREESVEDVVAPSLVQRFNATFDRKGPTAIGAEAPPMIHICLCLPAVPTAELGPDGHPERGGFLPPVPMPRRMWAGGSFVFHAPVHIGATILRRSRIVDVSAKQGRSGQLCFVAVEHEISSDGVLAISERHDIVYREIRTDAQAASTPETAALGAHSRTVAATAPLLFRYSALTFNGHRIHYDAPYATGPENYPGLVVHGPMQATLLCQFAADLKGASPKRFDFRSLSPLFDTSDFSLNAEPAADGLRLWTARSGGPVAMEAQARW